MGGDTYEVVRCYPGPEQCPLLAEGIETKKEARRSSTDYIKIRFQSHTKHVAPLQRPTAECFTGEKFTVYCGNLKQYINKPGAQNACNFIIKADDAYCNDADLTLKHYFWHSRFVS